MKQTVRGSDEVTSSKTTVDMSDLMCRGWTTWCRISSLKLWTTNI